jgi:hypothetical protein
MVDKEPNSNADPDHSWLRNLASPWLAFYSLTFIVGGSYLAFVAAAENTVLRGATAAAAIYCIIVGVLLWIRSRFALRAYIFAGIAFVGWAVFRVLSSGMTTSRIGIMIGGFLILVSYSSLVEILDEQRP